MNEESVHIIMGTQEAAVIGTALGLMVEMLKEDIEAWEDKNEETREQFFAMLSIKLTTEKMFTSIKELLKV